METAPFLRAAGAYAQELGRELGRLSLEAAVLAIMRKNDPNSYTPDKRIVPQDASILYRQLRVLLNESESILTWADQWLLDNELPPLERLKEIKSWFDARALCSLAVSLGPSSPLARVTLANALLREEDHKGASRQLDLALEFCQEDTELQGRVLRNMAAVAELSGDPQTAVQLVLRASSVDGGHPLTRESAVGYAVTNGMYDLVRQLLAGSRQELSASSTESTWRFLTRRNTFPEIRLRQDPDMVELVARGLRIRPCGQTM